MKRIIVIFICVMMLSSFIGCADSKVIDGIRYNTYGLINESENRNEQIKYRLVIGNIFWSIALVETIIAPIYFFGFSIYEPVGKKNPNEPKGAM